MKGYICVYSAGTATGAGRRAKKFRASSPCWRKGANQRSSTPRTASPWSRADGALTASSSCASASRDRRGAPTFDSDYSTPCKVKFRQVRASRGRHKKRHILFAEHGVLPEWASRDLDSVKGVLWTKSRLQERRLNATLHERGKWTSTVRGIVFGLFRIDQSQLNAKRQVYDCINVVDSENESECCCGNCARC